MISSWGYLSARLNSSTTWSRRAKFLTFGVVSGKPVHGNIFHITVRCSVVTKEIAAAVVYG